MEKEELDSDIEYNEKEKEIKEATTGGGETLYETYFDNNNTNKCTFDGNEIV